MTDILREFYHNIRKVIPDASVEFVYNPLENIWGITVNGKRLDPKWTAEADQDSHDLSTIDSERELSDLLAKEVHHD